MSPLVRRVVTGHNAKGTSVVVADDTPPFVVDTGEGEATVTLAWATNGAAVVPYDGSDPTLAIGVDTVFPTAGGSRLMIVRHPPGSGTHIGDPAGSDTGGVHFDDTGMHATDTVDYIIVVSGTIHMELDDGAEVALSAGEVVIQNGTRHGWRNRSESEAVLAVVLLGANRG